MLWVEQPVGTGFSQGEPDIHVCNRVLAKIQRANVGDAQNETELAAQLVGFLQQFFNVFAELKTKKFYLTGESVRFVCPDINLSLISFQYAGMYLPCWFFFVRGAKSVLMIGLSDIADYMFSHPTLLNIKVQGMWLGSRMFVRHICLLLHRDDDDSQLFSPRMSFRCKFLLWTWCTRI